MSTVKSLSKNDALQVEISCEEVSDSAVVAKSAGLRYVSDMSPGIKRKRIGKHFSYIGLDGKPIHDQEEVKVLTFLRGRLKEEGK